MARTTDLRIEPARESDTPVILRMIKALVDCESLAHELTVTESMLRQALFGAQPASEVVLGYVGTESVGFAVYFPTFSTASGRTGLYLEDLYVEPQWRGLGFGRQLFAHVAKGGGRAWCRMVGAQLESVGDSILPVRRSRADTGFAEFPSYG